MPKAETNSITLPKRAHPHPRSEALVAPQIGRRADNAPRLQHAIDLCTADAERRFGARNHTADRETFTARVTVGSLAHAEAITVTRRLGSFRVMDAIYVRDEAACGFTFDRMA
jgi:hypothetical protein